MLYVLRHAEAEQGFPDELRPLTLKGCKQSQTLGRFLKKQKIVLPETIWHSGLERAKTTATELLRGLEQSIPLEEVPLLRPNEAIEPIIRKLKAHGKPLMIVGHNPFLTILINEIISFGAHDGAAHVRKASLWAFTPITTSTSGKSWQLEWSIYADQLAPFLSGC